MAGPHSGLDAGDGEGDAAAVRGGREPCCRKSIARGWRSGKNATFPQVHAHAPAPCTATRIPLAAKCSAVG